MNKQRYEKFKAVMEAVKKLDIIDVSTTDYRDKFSLTLVLEEEEK